MKKIAALGLCLLLALAFTACRSTTAPASTSTEKVGGVISQEEAKQLALTHAGVTENEVTFSPVTREDNWNSSWYEIKMYNNFNTYYYKIDEKTGEILSSISESNSGKNTPTVQPETPGNTAPTPVINGKEQLTLEQAKKIALVHGGVSESDATFYKVKLDTENGRQVYEIEFYTGNKEFDYEIDAYSGEIIEYDQDIEELTAESSGDIGEEKAKEIALGLVQGATSSHIQIKRTSENGRTVYEGEIHYNGEEYEFKIDAGSGTVLEWSGE